MKPHHWLLLAVAIIAIAEVQTIEYNEQCIVEEKVR